MRRALPLLLLLLTAACTSTHDPAPLAVPAPPSPSPARQGPVPAAALEAMLLQAADLPDLPTRRPYASADLVTDAVPQLALCRPAVADAPHEVANVYLKPTGPGRANAFEVLSVYADATAAQAAYARALDAARACPSYTANGLPYRVQDLAPVSVAGADAAAHYRLTTPSVVSGDVRTLGRRGRALVLVTGFGAPAGGRTLLDFQADVLGKALARVG